MYCTVKLSISNFLSRDTAGKFKRSPVEDGVVKKLGRSLTGAGGMQSVCMYLWGRLY